MADAALIVKPGNRGFNYSDITRCFGEVDSMEVYPVEILARVTEETAYGLITPRAAEKLDLEYGNESAFGDFVAAIMDDEDRDGDGMYDFGGITFAIMY